MAEFTPEAPREALRRVPSFRCGRETSLCRRSLRVEPLRVEIGHFAECVRSGRRPLSDGPHGRDVVAVLEAAQALGEPGRHGCGDQCPGNGSCACRCLTRRRGMRDEVALCLAVLAARPTRFAAAQQDRNWPEEIARRSTSSPTIRSCGLSVGRPGYGFSRLPKSMLSR